MQVERFPRSLASVDFDRRSVSLEVDAEVYPLNAQKRAGCAKCRYDSVCEGVWGNYLHRYGWDELKPVT